jgi:hypothetical protein
MPDSAHQHSRVQIRTQCATCGQVLDQRTFNSGDLEQQQLSELPDRQNMSLVNANLAIPVNLGLAANILSDGSIAQAGAFQNTPIDQSSMGGLPTTTGG